MKLTVRKMAHIALGSGASGGVFTDQYSRWAGSHQFGVACCVCDGGGSFPEWEAVIATLLYLALGAAGLPIFSGFNGGFGALAGPTGGYLIGYLPAAYLAGVLCRKTQSYKNYILGMVLGLVVCYLLGDDLVYHKHGDWHLAGAFKLCFPVFAGRRSENRSCSLSWHAHEEGNSLKQKKTSAPGWKRSFQMAKSLIKYYQKN